MKTKGSASEFYDAKRQLQGKVRQGGALTLDRETCVLVMLAGGPTFSSKRVRRGRLRCNQTGHIIKWNQTRAFRARVSGMAVDKPPPKSEKSQSASTSSSTSSNRRSSSSSSSSMRTIEWTGGSLAACPHCGRMKAVYQEGVAYCDNASCYKPFKVVDRRGSLVTVTSDSRGEAECPGCGHRNSKGLTSGSTTVECWYCHQRFVIKDRPVQQTSSLPRAKRDTTYDDAQCPYCRNLTPAPKDGEVTCRYCDRSFIADSNA